MATDLNSDVSIRVGSLVSSYRMNNDYLVPVQVFEVTAIHGVTVRGDRSEPWLAINAFGTMR